MLPWDSCAFLMGSDNFLPFGDMCSAFALISTAKSSRVMLRKAWTARQEALSFNKICSTSNGWYSWASDGQLSEPKKRKYEPVMHVFLLWHLIEYVPQDFSTTFSRELKCEKRFNFCASGKKHKKGSFFSKISKCRVPFNGTQYFQWFLS